MLVSRHSLLATPEHEMKHKELTSGHQAVDSQVKNDKGSVPPDDCRIPILLTLTMVAGRYKNVDLID